MVLGLIRKIKLIHSESKPQPPIQNKITTGVSAACYIQLFSKTFSIYGNWTCFQFMEIELVFNFTKANTVSDHRVMTFFGRNAFISAAGWFSMYLLCIHGDQGCHFLRGCKHHLVVLPVILPLCSPIFTVLDTTRLMT